MSAETKKKQKEKLLIPKQVLDNIALNNKIRNRARGMEWDGKTNSFKYIFKDSDSKTFMRNGHERKILDGSIPDIKD